MYVDPDWLNVQGVKVDVEIPWWLRGEHDRYRLAIDGSKAIASGLKIRPIEEMIRDGVTWEDSRPPQKAVPKSTFSGQAVGDSLTRDRELELIKLWSARTA